MKTDAKTMAEIYRHMADNLDAGIDQLEGIGYLQLKSQKWVKKETSVFDFENTQYCILPKTITVNGVEIPKPLTREEIDKEHTGSSFLYFPCGDPSLFIARNTAYCLNMNAENFYCYKTEEEAIEASKKLFGIE